MKNTRIFLIMHVSTSWFIAKIVIVHIRFKQPWPKATTTILKYKKQQEQDRKTITPDVRINKSQNRKSYYHFQHVAVAQHINK